ncbi:uncharacterized protein [Engystomops pustulosus]|uniref:uncharacterized protein isoform X2 n=1 Tax=Engystomops pustulosus TaxID=76066 RepID=UPI003AFA4BC7
MLLILLSVIGATAAEDPLEVRGHLGQDLQLSVVGACEESSYRFDVHAGSKWILAYDKDFLQEMGGYKGRLSYDKKNCIVTLRRLQEKDGTSFTITLQYVRHHKLTGQKINYVVISDPVMSSPRSTTEKDQTSTDSALPLVSFCLSLDCLINALCTLLILVTAGRCSKLIVDDVTRGCNINGGITVVCQIISISTMISGEPSGWLLIVIPLILLADTLRSCGYLPRCVQNVLQRGLGPDSSVRRQCSEDEISVCQKVVLYIWIAVTLLLQVLFTICICIFYSQINSPHIGYIVLSVSLSIGMKLLVFICCHIYYTIYSSVTGGEETTLEDTGDATKATHPA